jgi:hypothetical protein
MSKPARRWCFTLNNPSEEDYTQIYNLEFNQELSYGVVGLEKGSQNGTVHFQGYLIMKAPWRLSKCRELFDTAAHFEIAIADTAKNRLYCTKEGNFFEFGNVPEERSSAGGREKKRWEEARELAKEGSIDDIDASIYVPYYRTLKEIKKDYMQQEEDLDGVCGVWIYGKAGVGKSRKARELYPDFYYKLANKWWDGYQNQRNVLIEDLGPEHKVLGHHLKLWADRYAFNGETKGGMINIRPDKVVVTTQYSLDQIFDDEETRQALNRRFKVIHMMEWKEGSFN